ncbi:MAG: primosomal protein N' [Natronospirillum sp.]|uniref:primosomal protein N' n=1 Tax=Natronospirillum sp. TaxID=2812955 RepID=UPI0025FE0151|nr:primosomal protein N' [Natronospirillum sp.]MCH8550415.1 primosomal protein N' [Natronospirillum sp.]
MDVPDSALYSVAVFCPLHQTFTYSGPSGLQRGQRVRVPFGSRQLGGVITDTLALAPEGIRLRALTDVPDEHPMLPADNCALAEWLARYYHAPIGEAYELCLPAAARPGLALPAARTIRHLSLTPRGRALDPTQLRGSKQQTLVRLLQQHSQLTREELKQEGIGKPTADTLCREELAQWTEQQASRPEPARASALTLSPAQNQLLIEFLNAESNSTPQLLLGATGSGKTELYIEWARTILLQGRQCLILLPEIGLTPQMVSRFSQRLGMTTAQLHSGMTDTARLRVWQDLAHNRIPLVLGTRSAVLAPFADLGLIIVDEEHDGSYKQQDGVRYHARDVALWRARQAGCPILLGSATPALESLQNARERRYQRHDLPRREDQGDVARSLIDLNRHAVAHGLSTPLVTRMDEHLQQGRQVMLFLNRRGIAPSMICDACGTIQHCPNCSAYVTYHENPARLLCHHCGWSHRPPYPCEHCAETRLVPLGLGTAGLEQYLRQRWPDTAIWRIDRDSIRNPEDWARVNSDIQAGQSGILLGTQMLAKGHDYPNVTLTGILDADSGLFSADFRAFERTAQLLTQVSGRAGRRRARAEILLQTRLPEHPLLNRFLTSDYANLASHLLEERQQADMPPFSHLALLRADHPDETTALAFLSDLSRILPLPPEVTAVGPVPALMSRRAGHYRMLWLLKSTRRAPLHQVLDSAVLTVSNGMKIPGKLSWGIDVDPIEF